MLKDKLQFGVLQEGIGYTDHFCKVCSSGPWFWASVDMSKDAEVHVYTMRILGSNILSKLCCWKGSALLFFTTFSLEQGFIEGQEVREIIEGGVIISLLDQQMEILSCCTLPCAFFICL